jgi:hypothetical protein
MGMDISKSAVKTTDREKDVIQRKLTIKSKMMHESSSGISLSAINASKVSLD